MKLIDRYIEEVGKHLPTRTRVDIQTEIRSTLEDMLEDRAGATNRPVDDNLVKEVLKEYGAPDKVAASYLPARYLIGPRLYPFFTLVLKIVMSVLTVLALVGFGIRYGTSALTVEAFISIFSKSLIEYLGGIISAFGNIVLVFAILQWTLPETEFEDENDEKGWDPASLEKEPEPDEVGIWGPIWAIVMTIAALLVFNVYPQIIGFGFLDGNRWTFVPVLSQAFFQYLPWIDVIWVLQIVLNMILLRQGRWTTLTRWFEVILSILSIGTAYVLLKGPALINLNAETLARGIQDAEAANILAKMFTVIPPLILVMIIVIGTIDLLKKIYEEIIKPKPNITFKIK
jgi:hypothetical protein